MNRNEIETELTWDLTSLFKDQNAFDEQYEEAQQLLTKLKSYKTHIADSKETFIAFMEDDETFSRYLDNLYSYAKMMTDVEPSSEQGQENLSKAAMLYQKTIVATNFVSLEIIAHKEEIEAFLKDEDCKDFIYPMQEIFRTIPHRLDDEKEAMLAQVSELQRIPGETYDSLRLEYPSVVVNGKEEFLNDGTYFQFLTNKDASIRKQAFENYFGEYKRYQNTFMNLLTGNAKAQAFEARIRHYGSALEASLFGDGADTTLFYKVLDMANVKHKKPLHEYFAFRKQVLNLEEQHPYDIYLPLVKNVEKSYSIDESFEILTKALAPLGEEYISLLHKAREERWIDFLPCTGKIGGAYSGGSHDSKPFILANFNEDYESLSTLAHELGHSMHSYFSRRANRPLLSGYKIFVAEVASTVNEILLNKYLLATSDDKDYKATLLNNLLTQLVGTLYRQPMYAKFECKLHEMIEHEEAVSSQTLTQIYYDLNVDYFGDSVEVDELQRYGCYYIPHFYYNFYVYKYTLGMSVALSFVKKILAGDTKDYLKFLSKGGSEAPIDELIHAGVDPREDGVYDDAFTFFKETLDELKTIL
ncbi:oligoendopeptidase F [Amedibacillus sp. YH-ame6]